MSKKIAFVLDVSEVRRKPPDMDPELKRLMIGRSQSNASSPHKTRKQKEHKRKGKRSQQDRKAIADSRY